MIIIIIVIIIGALYVERVSAIYWFRIDSESDSESTPHNVHNNIVLILDPTKENTALGHKYFCYSVYC